MTEGLQTPPRSGRRQENVPKLLQGDRLALTQIICAYSRSFPMLVLCGVTAGQHTD